jgi:Fic family protein
MLEKKPNDQIHLSALVRIGIAHYQFETIHPFLDGNGRIGRLLICLDLVSKNLLSKPTLYLSDYFERNKSHYYDNLTRVRTHNDLNQWLKFFMVGIIESSQNSVQTFKKILLLKEAIDGKLLSFGRKAALAKTLITHLYKTPIFHSQQVEEWLSVTTPTANALIKDLQKAELLKELTGFKRNRLFAFENYLKIFA